MKKGTIKGFITQEDLTVFVGQIWKSKYSDIYYKVFGGSKNDAEIYDLDNIWDSKVISKKELIKHFELIEKSDLQKLLEP
jgi:hypothetical protein